MKMAKRNKKQQGSKLFITLGAVVLIVVALLLLNNLLSGKVGQAIFVGEQPFPGGVVDLVTEQKITFTSLEESRDVQFITNLDTLASDEEHQTFFFEFHVNEDSLIYTVNKGPDSDLVALDTLSFPEDTSYVYLNEEDASADLVIFLENNELTITNLQFVSADRADIILLDENDEELPSLLHLNVDEEFVVKIRSSSTTSPQLRVNFGQLTEVEQIFEDGVTEAVYTYTPSQSEARVLDITATVGEQETHKHYTLAVGNVIYALQERNNPLMTLMEEESAFRLDITFARTTDLQPLGLPCKPQQRNLENVFADTNVRRVYANFNGEQKVWIQGDAPDDLTLFEDWQGYFVQLTNAEETEISLICDPYEIRPLSQLPNFNVEVQDITFEAGWNLISVPGHVPLRLTDLVNHDNFEILTCTQGHSCEPASKDALLNPGKPYWVYSEQPLRLRYTEGQNAPPRFP